MKELILDRLKKSEKLSFFQIAKLLNVKRHNNKQLGNQINELISLFKIGQDINGDFFLIKQIGKYQGKYKSSSKGFGFLELDNKSIFIHKKNSQNALNDDDVEVIEFYVPSSNRTQGIVTKIIKRKTTTLVGVVTIDNGKVRFSPINNASNSYFKFEDIHNIKTNYIYKVKILNSSGNALIIKPIKCLGHKDQNNINVESMIESSDIKIDFSKSIINELNEIPNEIQIDSNNKRVDLRDKLIFTIDGADSKDFDDAISIEQINNTYHLFVHIADVSHYVQSGTQLDLEAFKRGTSIYLVDRVIPMLPKKISNGICSLNPNVDRFAITCEMTIDNNGKTISTKFYESIINSKFRLTYDFVNDFFAKKDVDINSHLAQNLLLAKELSSLIRNNKKESGYVDFEISETLIKLDENKNVIKIFKRHSGVAQKMIEDFMVKANEAIADFIEKQELPFIYRIHDVPTPDKFESLQKILNILRIDEKVSQSDDPLKFANLIDNIKKQRFDDFIKISLLRTMSKAKYSSQNIGHYGLASNSYTHFTSPIRRYSDLIVHRILRELIFNNNDKLKKYFNENVDNIAKSCSESEVKSMDLERKISDLKKAEYYEKFLNHKFSGQIVSILDFGIFIEIDGMVSGLVHKSNLPRNTLIDSEKMIIVHNNELIKIGSNVNIKIKSIDKMLGKINLELL